MDYKINWMSHAERAALIRDRKGIMDISDFFRENNRAAIAYSGGVDSIFLLLAAVSAGADVKAYHVRSQLQPAFELRDAVRMADLIGMDAGVIRDGSGLLRLISTDILEEPAVRSNPPDRCYHCKKRIMSAVIKAARADGYELVCDGTNASDPEAERPGMKALRELGIRSPLRECGIGKEEIRRRLREAGIPLWDKPAYACLATRIETGLELTPSRLARTEKAEGYLADMGFSDHRVRTRRGQTDEEAADTALVQVKAGQMAEALKLRADITARLGTMYSKVIIDEETR